MVCHLCQAAAAKKFGKDRRGNQRYRCRVCRKTFSTRPERPLPAAMRISPEKALLILQLLCEGSGIRAIGRITGCHQATILKLLTEVGAGCERMLAERIKGLAVRDVQGDEIWTYIGMKEGKKTRRGIADPEVGDAYCFTALERHSKLILAWPASLIEHYPVLKADVSYYTRVYKAGGGDRAGYREDFIQPRMHRQERRRAAVGHELPQAGRVLSGED
jgi:transposase-like protein